MTHSIDLGFGRLEIDSGRVHEIDKIPEQRGFACKILFTGGENESVTFTGEAAQRVWHALEVPLK